MCPQSNPKPQIYVSDMDGTLLQDDAVLSDYSRKGLIRLIENGINFTVASARSIVAIREAMGDIPFRLPVIGINGAFVSEYKTGRHIIINDMNKDLLEDIYARILRHGCMPFVSGFDGKQDRLYYERLINDAMKWYHDNRKRAGDYRLTYTESLQSEFYTNRVVALSVMNDHDNLKDLADELESELGDLLENHFFENPYSPPWWWLTIHDKKSCKAVAVQKLVEYCGFSIDDLVVFGDNLNDVNMFKTAGKAVAVKNATDEIKSYADEIIGSNQTDSVVRYLLKENGMKT